jgi:hypothetical protein
MCNIFTFNLITRSAKRFHFIAHGRSPQSSKQWYRTKPVVGKYRVSKKQGIDTFMTYGDPAYYGKVGFLPVAEHVVPAPFPLSMPIG